MIFPRDKINTIPLEHSRVKCYNGISVRLRMNSVTIIYQKYFCAIAGNYIYSNVVKKYQQPSFSNATTPPLPSVTAAVAEAALPPRAAPPRTDPVPAGGGGGRSVAGDDGGRQGRWIRCRRRRRGRRIQRRWARVWDFFIFFVC